MDAKDLGDLVHYNDQPDAGSETHEYRFGDEVGHEAQAQEASQQKDCADEKRQRG
jgi:hypothetical protein